MIDQDKGLGTFLIQGILRKFSYLVWQWNHKKTTWLDLVVSL